MHDEFEMSMIGKLNFFLGLQIKQMEDDIFFNQSKYIKEMLNKFALEDSKPMKTPMSSDTKLIKDEEYESVDMSAFVPASKRLPKPLTLKRLSVSSDTLKFECLLEINEQVYPRFILEFYSQYRLSYSDEGQMFVKFVIQNQYFSLCLEDFAQILRIPCEGACVFSDRWSLDELVYSAPSKGPYQTNLPSSDDIISCVREDR
ncbi:DNA helicase PIF1-like protein [Tanacetum coccineum]